MKIKFIFELNNGTIVTNDTLFDRELLENSEDELIAGCVVEFKTVPMLQDYQNYVNEIWCNYLQWEFGGGFDGGKQVKKVTTELVEG